MLTLLKNFNLPLKINFDDKVTPPPYCSESITSFLINKGQIKKKHLPPEGELKRNNLLKLGTPGLNPIS